MLQDYESRKDTSVSPMIHEGRWENAKELRQELNDVRMTLIEFADCLAKVASVPSLVTQKPKNDKLAN